MKGVGGVGGSDDVEYTLRAALMVPIASERSNCREDVAGTEVTSGPGGVVRSLRNPVDDEMSKRHEINKLQE